ncbi:MULTISPECIES: nitrile hydratase accessory protein [unclassified Paenibacillus]|uniref:nitrile hydratase accessory protein n=1 Tax=unclassified Paenibacillus TaxID=185978 RepID=UPI001AE85083|nr:MULTISPECIES: nitrile hydratase accessory protein [unclassified Paenibacillus]MBP1154498.1 nitrile hydratase [Paenibacillus sp. PvP091]MBP1170118.1 nitrile hydratase [Paenibacillus sp. PvR098]MBP2441146.1 nitrile hydratase [Paenibacillus sp. PvP052]
MDEDSKVLMNYIQESANLPRENGELIFKTPWEGRIFAMAVLLLEKGFYPWKVFNGQFVREIGEAERQNPETDVVTAYYQHWVHAFEKVLVDKEVFTEEQLKARTHEFTSGQRHHVC